MEKKIVLGIDFGGTKIKIGLVLENGKILGEALDLLTESHRREDEIIGTMVEGIERITQNSDLTFQQIVGIGIGSPGPLDLKNGTILDPPNLPTLHNFPLKQTLENYFNLPVAINNDANCFVLGEAYFGTAQNAAIVCGATLGTGFGLGVVIDRKIYTGSTGTAAEVWCSPYADQNFEAYGSARAITRIYQQITGQELEAREIFDLAEQADQDAIAAWSEFGVHLGRIFAIITNLLDPDVIVLGGSVSHAWEFFYSSLIENLHNNINQAPREHIQVVRTVLGDNAGVLGAAALLLS
ncbi:MAG: ROK family protein [bacterium]|nr:MAG: ROK family protein [bacterium]